MKNLLKRGLALLIVLMILVSSIYISSAAVSRPQANTGIRDQVCTTFNNTTAPSYYTGTYSYANLSTLSSSSLKSTLTTLMTSTHKNTSSYDNCRDYAPYTDCEGGDSSHFTMLYTSYSATYSQYNNGQGWNREHVWPQSLGGGNTSGGGADLHHIRPDESKTNSTRGNRKYGNVNGGSNATGNLSGEIGGQYGGNNLYEPLDNVKGDVARICLYVYVRWGSSWGADSITEVFQSVDVLLEWCALDPVDTWEMERNDVVEGVQGNRNVFIDYPELAWELYDRTAPTTMKSPSGKAASGNSGSGNVGGDDIGGGNVGGDDIGGGSTPSTPSCTHTNKTVTGVKEASCIDGYTGDTKCADCGKLLSKGKSIPAYSDHTFDIWMEVTPATETESGIMSRHCFICGFGEVDTIPKLQKSNDNTVLIIIAVASTSAIVISAGIGIFFVVKKKKP